MRQLSVMLKCIDSRQRKNWSMQAAFHGITIPTEGGSGSTKPNEMSEAETSMMNRAKAEAKLRKAQEFAKRHG